MSGYAFELLGILIALGLLIFLAFRGYTLRRRRRLWQPPSRESRYSPNGR